MIKEFLKQGETLNKGDCIQNELGVTFILQNDGNLVLYDDAIERSSSNVLWSEDSIYGRGEQLIFEMSGNLVLYDKNNQKVWETNTKGTNSNVLIIDNFSLKLLYAPNGRILQVSLLNPKLVIKPNKGLFDKPIKVGVVLIGSLLWQNDGSNGEENLRKNWRDNNFETKHIPVKFPIRYGRMSSGNVYTMVVSESCTSEDKLGTAMLLMANKTFESVADVYEFAIEIAKAEGMVADGNAVLKLSWAFISYAKRQLSKKFNTDTKTRFDNIWGVRARKDNFYENLKMDYEINSPINNKGELNFLRDKWLIAKDKDEQSYIDDLDLVLTTVTKPRFSYSNTNGIKTQNFSRYPNIDELFNNVTNDKERCYVYNNIIYGIKTYQDWDIINSRKLDKYNPKDLFKINRFQCYRTPQNLIYFSSNGQIILYNVNDWKVYWESPKSQTGDYLEYQKDGNLVIYDNLVNDKWSADVYNHKGIDKKDLSSYNCENYLEITSDNRLNVICISLSEFDLKKFQWKSPIYYSYRREISESFTLERGDCIFLIGAKIYLSNDGKAIVETSEGKLLWSSPNDVRGDKFCFQDDGNLVLYDGNNTKWASGVYFKNPRSKTLEVYIDGITITIYKQLCEGRTLYWNSSVK